MLDQVLDILKRISDEDCLLLGLNPKFARPDWMILQVLPIPPPPVRPSVMMGTYSRSEVSLVPLLFCVQLFDAWMDYKCTFLSHCCSSGPFICFLQDDLTHQLSMIIWHNENLRRQQTKRAPAHIITEVAQLLQFYIATYFDNDLSDQPKVSILNFFSAYYLLNQMLNHRFHVTLISC